VIPLPLACLFHLGLGLGFALAARGRIRADGPYASPAFVVLAAHVGFVVAPLCLYFYLVQPDWTWLYWVAPTRVPTLAIVPLVVGHAALVLAGWLLGARLLRAGRQRLAIGLVVGLGAALVLAAALALPRLVTAASYAGYHHGVGRGLMSVELGWAVVVSLLATTVTVAYSVVELARDGRRARTR